MATRDIRKEPPEVIYELRVRAVERKLQGQTHESIAQALVVSVAASRLWWQGKTWSKIRSEAPTWVIERLEVYSRLIAPLEAESAKLTAQIEAAADQKIPRGVGPLTFEVLRREVGDWSRFTNRLFY